MFIEYMFAHVSFVHGEHINAVIAFIALMNADVLDQRLWRG